MQEALRLGDGDRLMRAAHSLKGAALSMGAIGLSERCRQVERRAHGADFKGAASELRDIDPLFEQTCQIIRQIN